MFQGYAYAGHQQPLPQAQPMYGAPPQGGGWNSESVSPPPPSFPQQPFYSGPPPSSNPPAQTATYNLDPNGFAAMYNAHLATLTFNSKPIITNLTVMAHENVQQMANVIARCIDEHITQVQPTHRLPSLYLLDSISKNIGPPYTSLWAQRIAHLFLESYRIVDQPTKMRMEELLNTWRSGARDGTPLFGGDAQWEIERNLYGSQGVPPQIAGPPPQAPAAMSAHQLMAPQSQPHYSGSHSPMPEHGHQPHDERWRAVEQIDRLLASQTLSPTRVAALKQLRTVLQTTTLAPQEMEQIQNQLTSLSQQARERSSTPTLTAPAVSATPPPAAIPQLPAGLSDALASLSKLGGINGLASAATGQMSGHTQPSAPTGSTEANSTPSSSSSDLIKSLMAAGLLPATSGTAASSTSSGSSPIFQQDSAYSSAVLSLELQFTSMDLHKDLSSTALELLVPRSSSRYPLPLRCRQCANRYPEGPSGQKSLDTHIDWHFRQGRRAKDSAARGLSRTWLDRAHDWIRGGHDDPAAGGGAGGNDPSGSSSSTGAKNGLTAQQEAELASYSASWVVAPTDPNVGNAPCPICKEKFSSEWSEDEEEWIWRNATRRTDAGGSEAYYHGSCYYSAKVLSANVTSSSRPTTTPPADGARRSASVSATLPSKRGATPANPLDRVREQEGSATTAAAAQPVGAGAVTDGSPDGASASASRKRKESPAVADGGAAGGDHTGTEDGPNKKPVLTASSSPSAVLTEPAEAVVAVTASAASAASTSTSTPTAASDVGAGLPPASS
ncbi:unnamed protein product [Parajaminaea phylloscopi]